MKKKAYFYYILLVLWAALLSLLWYFIISEILKLNFTNSTNYVLAVLLGLNGLFFSYFWLNGVKDFLYVNFYWAYKRKRIKKFDKILETKVDETARVVLAYCTCDDFEPEPLLESMKQDYSNFTTVILDDSKTIEFQNQIDKFAAVHNVLVIRRKDHHGFKAGNINNYFIGKVDYDYMVILDSDEIIPSNFIKDCLKYFKYYENIGIVQCTHISTRNRNNFMKTFYLGVNSHWPTYQTMKHDFGFLSMLGHGAMIKREAYDSVNGFPQVVAEDLCISIELRNKGFYTAFAPNIICEEEYPIDYIAFKKRHSKWTQGNYEFMKRYTGKILKSKMSWFEKLDIFLFTYNLPLTAFFSLFLLLNIFVIPFLGYSIQYPAWMLGVTVVFFLSPMLNDIYTYTFRINFFKELRYLLLTYALYGSMMWISLKASILGMFGKKAKFIVTPKESRKRNAFQAFSDNYQEFLYMIFLFTISCIGARSLAGFFSVLLIIVPIIISPYLDIMANSNTYSLPLLERKAY